MKPVNLKIEGLNSFLERQEIDFKVLSDTGVFGIFGPTGSGKSSILDAITLALYGKVERASRGTQGIINHSADKVWVEFTFEIGLGQERQIYRVSRIYRRAGDNNVHNAQSRLSQLSPEGEIVLADKDKDVSKQVTEIIGLNDDDFTRAVVLPQGKFAEFLNLEGAKRNKMLQRLFGLEDYGSRLNDKIKIRLNEAEKALVGIQGELQGLGDASPEALTRASVELQQALKLKEASFRERQKLRREFEQWKEVWALQEEFLQKGRLAAQLEIEKPAIQLKAARLESALKAELVQPYLEAAGKAEEELKVNQGRVNHLAGLLEEVLPKVRDSEQAYETARSRRKQEEPRLTELAAKFTQVLKLEVELEELKDKVLGSQDEINAIDSRERIIKGALAELFTGKSSLADSIAGFKDQSAKLRVEPEQRALLAVALAAYQEWEVAQRDFLAASKEFKEKEASLTQLYQELLKEKEACLKVGEQVNLLEEQLKALKADQPHTEEKLLEMQQSLERGKHQVGNVEGSELELQRAINEQGKAGQVYNDFLRELGIVEVNQSKLEAETFETQTLLNKAEQNYQELELQYLALSLSQELQEGVPCPVCGSPHHPSPATLKSSLALEEARTLLQDYQKKFQGLQSNHHLAAANYAQIAAQLQGSQENWERCNNEVKVREKAVAEARSSLANEKLRLQSIPHLKDSLTEFEKKVERAKTDRQLWLAKTDQLQKELEGVRESLVIVGQRLAGTETAEQKGREDLTRAEVKLTETKNLLGDKREALDEAQKVMGGQEVLAAQEELSQRDRDGAVIANELEVLEVQLTDLNYQFAQKEEERNSLATVRAVLEEKLNFLTEQAGSKETQVYAVTSGRPAEELLAEAKANISGLINREEESQQALEALLQQKNRIEKEKAAAEALLGDIINRVEQTRQELQEALVKYNFGSLEEAQTAWLTFEVRQEIEREIKEFRDKEQNLKGQMDSLQEKLANRCLTPEQWQSWQEKIATAEKEYENLSELVGIAQKNWESMEQNNIRWLELEGQRQSLTTFLGRLELLRKIFKGDAFIEFIAKEQMENVALAASQRLKQMTGHRYALELDSEGSFIMRDDANGGVKRPVSTLSGGETFLTSLALALALSAQIQLKGQYPLEFFFLDEGFGTLDNELLDKVMNTLEELPNDKMTIGVISHVPDMRARMARRLIVEPAQPGGLGSRVKFEIM